jgi:hypothetical protein
MNESDPHAITGDQVVIEPTRDAAMASLFARQQPLAMFAPA